MLRPRRFTLLTFLPLFLLPGGCAERAGAAGGDGDTLAPHRVDSIFPPDEQLRRFRLGLEPADTLRHAAADRADLVARFRHALEHHDTLALRRLVLDRAEYGYLYYPGSRYTRPPLQQDPGIAWLLLQANSEKGIARVLRRFGGTPLPFATHQCGSEPEREGRNSLWTGCVLGTGDSATRLFGSIIERDGRFKFVSYANDL